MSLTQQQIDDLIVAGADRLLTRATSKRPLDRNALQARLRAGTEKYVLKHDPSANAAAVTSFLDGLHADDLLLVLACERGDADAWSDLFEGYGATVRSAARSSSSNESTADDLAQSIWAELHGLKTREDGTLAGKLGYYSGAGSLGGWLRAVVGQLAVDHHRKQARMIQTEEDGDFDRLAISDPEPDGVHSFHAAVNPEELLATELAAAHVEKALALALSALADEDRLLMKLYYFDGLRLREAGAVLGVHEATASRRLSRLHGEIRQSVESILMREHGWTKSEAARSLSEVATHLQTELEPMLTPKVDSSLQGSPAGG